MLKLLGLSFLFLGCTGAGRAAGAALKERVLLLEELQHVLKILEGEIRHGHASLPEAFCQAGRRSQTPYREFFIRTAERINEMPGLGLGEILGQAEEEIFSETPLKVEDRKILRELGERLGARDVESQLGILALAWEQALAQTERAREEYRQKSRVARYLGVCGGLFLAVLFF